MNPTLQKTKGGAALISWAILPAKGWASPQFIEIEHLEEVNLLYDAGRQAGKLIGDVPSLPGLDKFGDNVFNIYGAQRDENNERIDRLLQKAASEQ